MAFAQITLMGNLGKDPETFSFNGRNGVTEGVKFSVAVSHGKDEKKVTDWFDCTCFGATAKTAKDWLAKGKPVIIQGDLTIRPWEGKEGKKGTSLEVNVDKIRFVPSGEKNGNGGGPSAPLAVSAGRNAAPSAEIDDGDCPF
jgi:single-strand DNA-binding protein